MPTKIVHVLMPSLTTTITNGYPDRCKKAFLIRNRPDHQRQSRMYLCAGCEQETAHAAGLTHAPRGDGGQHVLHRVIDSQPSRHTSTRRVYVPSIN